MKKRTAFLASLLTTVVVILTLPNKLKAEKYLCRFELSNLNREGEFTEASYEREGKNFFSFYEQEKIIYSILKETDKFLIITNTYSPDFPEILVTFIDKQTNEVYENYLDIRDGGKPAYPIFGNCIVSK